MQMQMHVTGCSFGGFVCNIYNIYSHAYSPFWVVGYSKCIHNVCLSLPLLSRAVIYMIFFRLSIYFKCFYLYLIFIKQFNLMPVRRMMGWLKTKCKISHDSTAKSMLLF